MLVVGLLSLLITQSPEETWAWALSVADASEKPALEAAAMNRIIHPGLSTDSIEKREVAARAFVDKMRSRAAAIGPDERLNLEGDVWLRVRDGAVSVDARERETADVSFVLVNLRDREPLGTAEQQEAWAKENPSTVAATRIIRPDDVALVNGRVVVFALADSVTVKPSTHYKNLKPVTIKAAPAVLPRQKVPTLTTSQELWRLFLQGRPAKAVAPEGALRALVPELSTARDEFAAQRARTEAETAVAAARLAKAGPVELAFLMPWNGTYDFKLNGYAIEWPNRIPYGLDSVAVVAERGGSLFLPVAADLAEQQMSWRLQPSSSFAGVQFVYVRVRGKKLGAVSGQERHDQALRSARGLERMSIGFDAPGPDELRLQIDSIDVLAVDGSFLGTALPRPTKKKR